MLDMTIDMSVSYLDYKRELVANMGFTWKQAATLLFTKFPPAWKGLIVREFLATLRRTCLSLYLEPADENTVFPIMRGWIWDRVSDENRKFMVHKDITSMATLAAACHDLAETQSGYLFPNKRDKQPLGRHTLKRQGEVKQRKEGEVVTCYKCGEKGHYSSGCSNQSSVCFNWGKSGHLRVPRHRPHERLRKIN